MFRLTDKVVFLTGCGSVGPGWGNGKSIAVLFARQGARIFGVDISESAARETQAISSGARWGPDSGYHLNSQAKKQWGADNG